MSAEETAALGDFAALAEVVSRVESNLRTNGDSISAFSAWGMADALVSVVTALRAHRCTPNVEVVSGEEAQALPPGSAVVDKRDIELGCNPPARVRLSGKGHMPASWTGPVPGLARDYRVVYRASLPKSACPLAVGDTVTTAEQLNGLPKGAGIRDGAGHLADRVGGAPGWVVYAPDGGRFSVPVLPARVLDLPEAGDPS